ncbi:Mediator of RNA polymerase II transcription subunit 15a [Cardamine amara subsp. amara]|uniref:Mediator of RNA polymerase II transcription subunit 15a n=1 Tax=Cardamine amara subsp. amara TaxID=228776 RepID=A0ABD1BW34_CARAN
MIVNKIMETLKKHLPHSGPEGIDEIRRIAARFEDKMFTDAISQTDYLRSISMKMLTMDSGVQNAAASSSSYIPAPNNGTFMDSSLPNGEPAMDTADWRTQLPTDSRQKIVNKIMETLKKHLPFSGPEGINELRRIAANFEEKILSGADNQTDYLRKISMKMLTMETKSQNAACSSSSIPAANYSLTLNSGEPSMNTCYWRTQLPPDSRQKNATKIMEALMKHVPTSDQQGYNELMRIAVSFEDLIFNTAINQVDYFRKISFKLLSVTGGN